MPLDGTSLIPGPPRAAGSWQPTAYCCPECSGLWLAIRDAPGHAEVADRDLLAGPEIDPGRPRSLQGLSLDVFLSKGVPAGPDDGTRLWRLQVRYRGSDFVITAFDVCARCHGVWWGREDQDEEFGRAGLDSPDVEGVAMGPFPEEIANLVLELLGGALDPNFHVFSASSWKSRAADARRQLSGGHRPYRPSELRQEWGGLYDRIVQLLWEADPMGLDSEDPDQPTDEYAPEARTILPRLSECQGPNDVQRVVHEEFVRWFTSGRVGSVTHYQEIGRKIWFEYERRRKIKRVK